jgi:hypothetical protein
MKRLLIGLVVTALALGTLGPVQRAEAGNKEWAVAGKVLAGLMVLDVVGQALHGPVAYPQPVYAQPQVMYPPAVVQPPVTYYQPPVCRPPMPTPRAIFQEGYRTGYGDGFQDGRHVGFQQGRQVGFQRGTQYGYQVGVRDGFGWGVHQGYQTGYRDASWGWGWSR